MLRIRIYSLLIGLLTLLEPAPAASPVSSPRTAGESGITVRLYTLVPEAVPHLPRAIEEADLVFQKAGLQIHWVDCSGADRLIACDEASGRNDIRLRIVPGKGHRDLGSALGYALASTEGEGIYATAFFGAVAEVRQGTAVSTSQVLGHVIAHEVGHLLLGDVRHSRNGLMSASWDPRDLSSIARREMRFSGAQTRRIREGARTRVLAAGGMAAAVTQLPTSGDGDSAE